MTPNRPPLITQPAQAIVSEKLVTIFKNMAFPLLTKDIAACGLSKFELISAMLLQALLTNADKAQDLKEVVEKSVESTLTLFQKWQEISNSSKVEKTN